MNALAKTVHLTPTKLRLAMIALLGIGIFFGTVGVAYAQGAVSADDVDSKLNDFILVAAAALVFFMAGRIRLPRRGTNPFQEHRQLHDQVVPRLLHSVPRILGLRLCAHDGRRSGLGHHRPRGLLPARLRGHRPRRMVLPDGLRRHGGYHHRGCRRRAHQDQRLLRVQLHRRCARLPHLRPLGMER